MRSSGTISSSSACFGPLRLALILVGVLCSGDIADAQAYTPPADIARDLTIPAAHEKAVREIATGFDQDAAGSAYRLRDVWARPLWESHDWARIENFSVRAIRAVPWDTGLLERLCVLRARAFMAARNPTAALACSKQLYDVASMQGTGAAMLVVERALRDMPNDGPALAEQFKTEQIAGAIEQKDVPAGTLLSTPNPAETSRFTQQIKTDPVPFESAITPLMLEDYSALTGRGNLLLLCGRPAEAMRFFERAYALAADNQLQQATDSIARAIKAEDGAIGRANSWLLAIAPRK